MDGSPLIKNLPDKPHLINHNTRVSEFISWSKTSNIDTLKEFLPTYIINKIISIPIPMSNIDN